MKVLALSTAVLALVLSWPTYAQRDYNGDDDRRHDNRRNYDDDDDAWRHGDRRPRIDPRDHRRDDDDREAVWRRHYSHAYVYQDDPAYTECKKESDPAGVIAGAFLGGILGNAMSHGDSGATVAGVVAGGALGFGLTQKMTCEDRSYAYKTYNEGFNSGRRDAYYDWNNPGSKDRGRFHVRDYYNDESGFRCAYYDQTAWVNGHQERVEGRACQQPNGVWAIID
jgi:surface antigen